MHHAWRMPCSHISSCRKFLSFYHRTIIVNSSFPKMLKLKIDCLVIGWPLKNHKTRPITVDLQQDDKEICPESLCNNCKTRNTHLSYTKWNGVTIQIPEFKLKYARISFRYTSLKKPGLVFHLQSGISVQEANSRITPKHIWWAERKIKLVFWTRNFL